MQPQGWGHIVNITATAAEQPIKGVPAPLASLTKGGLNSATKALAIEYASRGIRVNAVSPTSSGRIRRHRTPDSNRWIRSAELARSTTSSLP